MMDPELPYKVEYAESGKSTCQECRQKIENGKLRMAKIELSHLFDGLMPRWFHIDCFFDAYNPQVFETIANFDNIRWEDKLLVMNKIHESSRFISENYSLNACEADGVRVITFVIRTSNENGENSSFTKTIESESVNWDEMEKQTNEFFNLRNELKDLKDTELMYLMGENNQFYPFQHKYEKNGEQHYGLRSTLVDTVTDRMLFGALEYCQCNGYIVFEPNIGYKCIKFSPRFSSCQKTKQTARRSEFRLPESIKSINEFFNSYVSEVRTRVISPSIASLKLLDFLYDRRNEEIAVHTSYSSLESWTDVFEDCSKILVQTNIELNINKYWRIQIRKHRQEDKYWLVRNWGRIGTFRGDQLVEVMSHDQCVKNFNHHYEQKSNQNLQRKYTLMTTDSFDITNSQSSHLERPIRDLMKLIFNENVIIEELKQHGVKLEKIPMGMLSEEQFKKAKNALVNLVKTLKNRYGADEREALINGSNEFYSLMPHGFGNKRPPILDQMEALESEWQSLKQSRTMNLPRDLSSLDILFNKLNMDIEVLGKRTSDFSKIEQYVENSHSPKHNTYKIETDQVFVVKRHQEQEYKELGNKKLLWHGTKISNVASILSNGLKVSPTEAEKTGCTFGKGIYFTDVVSKAANFSEVKSENPMGILLLCEVALGKSKKCSEVRYVKNLQEKYNSIVVKGKYQSNYQESHFIEEIKIPAGKCQLVDDGQELNHNEYVVFDTAQIKIRYLVQVKFIYATEMECV